MASSSTQRNSTVTSAVQFRKATHGDVEEIIAFTTDTFEWGDYIPEMITKWIDDPSSVVMVAVDDSGIVGLARVVLLSKTEAWSHAARVRPDRRGEGIAGDLADVLLEWTRTHGALITRLLIEDDNESSIRHIQKKGFRRVATAVRARRTIGEATPNPEGNGARRTSSTAIARPVNAADAPMLAAQWPLSPCGRPLRGLVANDWRFHTLTAADLVGAAHEGGLRRIGSSWAITRQVGTEFDVSLLETNREEAFDTISSLIDLARDRGAEDFWMWLADLGWLTQAARRAGCDVSPSGIWVYSL
jgi:GNAT superfamily N-acetyltransferase